jgi:hypothetical protein
LIIILEKVCSKNVASGYLQIHCIIFKKLPSENSYYRR